jgi:hypothetical protein
MLNIRHHAEILFWYPTMSRDFYDWDLFIHYANAKIETDPKAFYSLLRKIKKDKADSPYSIIRKNIDWFIEAHTFRIQSINPRKPKSSNSKTISTNIGEEGEAGYILLQNHKEEIIRIPLNTFYKDGDPQKGFFIRSPFFGFSHFSDC